MQAHVYGRSQKIIWRVGFSISGDLEISRV